MRIAKIENVESIQSDVYEENDFLYYSGKLYTNKALDNIRQYKYNLVFYNIQSLEEYYNFINDLNYVFYDDFIDDFVAFYNKKLVIKFISKGLIFTTISLVSAIPENLKNIYSNYDNRIIGNIVGETDLFFGTFFIYNNEYYIYYNFKQYKFDTYKNYFNLDDLYIHIDLIYFKDYDIQNILNINMQLEYSFRTTKEYSMDSINALIYLEKRTLIIQTDSYYGNYAIVEIGYKKYEQIFFNTDRESYINHLLSGYTLLVRNILYNLVVTQSQVTLRTLTIPSISTNNSQYFYNVNLHDYHNLIDEGMFLQFLYENKNIELFINYFQKDNVRIYRKKTIYFFIPEIGILQIPNIQNIESYQYTGLLSYTTTLVFVYSYLNFIVNDSIQRANILLFDISISGYLLDIFLIRKNSKNYIVIEYFKSDTFVYQYTKVREYNGLHTEWIYNFDDLKLIFLLNVDYQEEDVFIEDSSFDFTESHFSYDNYIYRVLV